MVGSSGGSTMCSLASFDQFHVNSLRWRGISGGHLHFLSSSSGSNMAIMVPPTASVPFSTVAHLVVSVYSLQTGLPQGISG